MTLEYLTEQKTKYQEKVEYFQNINFNRLATDFQGIVDLIVEMEEYVKEKENGQDCEN